MNGAGGGNGRRGRIPRRSQGAGAGAEPAAAPRRRGRRGRTRAAGNGADAPAARGAVDREQRRQRRRDKRNGGAPDEQPVAAEATEAAGGGGRGGWFRRRRGLLPRPPGPPQDSQRTKPRMKKLRFALVLLGLSLLAFVSWVFGIMMAVAQDLPALEAREQYARAENSVVYDVNGEKLATLTNNEGRILLDSEEISPAMKEAVVAVEDARFYDHRGIDFQGMARALYQDILAGSARQGASTITQQFVKQALAAQENRTILQKFREAAIAYHLERQWSKDKILTEYLNEIYFGEGATGIEAAARTYFGWNHEDCGKEGAPSCASQLLPWEAAMLAGMISSPSAYSPRTSPEAALERRNFVLQRMLEQGYITESEYADYSQVELPAEKDILPRQEESQAPYFTSWLRQQLVDRYGAGEAFGGGLQIISTLDLDLQREVENAIINRVSGIGPTGSAVVLDNDTGAVRAMVGGFNYEESAFNLATNGHRQPGSAFKPFTLVTALEQGISPSTTYASAPQQIPFTVQVEKKNGKTEEVQELFKPSNYDDSYLGTADLYSGTVYSDNSVYAQLGMQVGPANVAETARKMGIESDLSSEQEYSVNDSDFEPYNPALILGGLSEGVTPLEMTHAYSTLAADGKRLSGTMAASAGGPLSIVKVTDGDTFNEGDLVPDQTGASGENKVVAKQVIDPGVAATATDILSGVVSSGTGENAQTGEDTWGKTGTTDDNGDAWFCGATEEITACVWVGHPDTVEPMLTEFGGQPVDGGTIPALLFADIVNAYTSLEDARNAGEDPDSSESTVPAPAEETGTYTPASDEAVAPEPVEPAATEAAAPADDAPVAPEGNTGGTAPASSGGLTP
jgi:penicillin-binding protein 1A